MTCLWQKKRWSLLCVFCVFQILKSELKTFPFDVRWRDSFHLFVMKLKLAKYLWHNLLFVTSHFTSLCTDILPCCPDVYPVSHSLSTHFHISYIPYMILKIIQCSNEFYNAVWIERKYSFHHNFVMTLCPSPSLGPSLTPVELVPS